MIKLLTAEQFRRVDQLTIEKSTMTSIELMEEAAVAFVEAFSRREPDTHQRILVLCGKGNNGGDGLAIARLLFLKGYSWIRVALVNLTPYGDQGKKGGYSVDTEVNRQRLLKLGKEVMEWSVPEMLVLGDAQVIIDAVFGTGFNRSLDPAYRRFFSLVNKAEKRVIAVDVPSGMPGEGPIVSYEGLKAMLTITFELPKLNFFFPESIVATEAIEVVGIGLDTEAMNAQDTYWYQVTKEDVQKRIKVRKRFSHKGTYGHALLIAGSRHSVGAALLAAKACVKSGAGLSTVALPEEATTALNTLLPECMSLRLEEDPSALNFVRYQAVGIGPGLGTDSVAQQWMLSVLGHQLPIVLDADALTVLTGWDDWERKVPAGSILTPHMKEFDRLFGEHAHWWDRVQTARKKAMTYGWIIILKNQYSFTCAPEGHIFINSTGGPAMAQGGMGDVLTGIITSLRAQGYPAIDSALIGNYLHGLAGDQLALQRSVVNASDLAGHLPETLFSLTVQEP